MPNVFLPEPHLTMASQLGMEKNTCIGIVELIDCINGKCYIASAIFLSGRNFWDFEKKKKSFCFSSFLAMKTKKNPTGDFCFFWKFKNKNRWCTFWTMFSRVLVLFLLFWQPHIFQNLLMLPLFCCISLN